MIKYSLQINKGIWHVSFYVKDINGKRKQKQLSTGIKGLDTKGKQINKPMKRQKKLFQGMKELSTMNSVAGHWINVLNIA